MKEWVKRGLKILLKDYQFNRIYFVDLPISQPPIARKWATEDTIKLLHSQEQFASAANQQIRDHAWYLDKYAHVYGIYQEQQLVCICAFWVAGHPRMPGRFMTLQKNEAVMVDLLTAPECRGKGYALAITNFAQNDLFVKGYRKLWTWVWHSNTPSIRVFHKAGWHYAYLLLEFQLYGAKDYLSFKLPNRFFRSHTNNTFV